MQKSKLDQKQKHINIRNNKVEEFHRLFPETLLLLSIHIFQGYSQGKAKPQLALTFRQVKQRQEEIKDGSKFRTQDKWQQI